MKVEFYLNFDKEIESLSLRSLKAPEPVLYFLRLQESLENELPLEKLPADNWYTAKLRRSFEPDGGGGSVFIGYEIVSLRCRTRFI